MSTERRRGPGIAFAFAAVALSWGITATHAHVGDPMLLEDCGSCHVGHGLPGQPMLAKAEEEFCYQCHGSAAKRSAMVSAGKLSPVAQLKDVEREFAKAFRHPVETGIGHSPTERLPSFSGAAVAHAECVDCHNPHQRNSAGRPQSFAVQGYSLSGQHRTTSASEYEVCFKCHSGRPGADIARRQILEEFALDGRSQHPVTRPAQGTALPSLRRGELVGATLRCSDCHTSDDPSGPRGPHGSNHRFLLSGNYVTDPVATESELAYAFCYSCHDRASILANESFPLHREHVEGDAASGRPGTSCYTCHASHGSREQPFLLRFNPNAVTRDELTGLEQYVQTGTRSGQCWLRCHGVNHGPKEYRP